MQASSRIIKIILISIGLTGCLDLAPSDRAAKARHIARGNAPYRTGQVYVMRGLGGLFSLGMNRLENTLETDYQVQTHGSIWYKTNNVSAYIIKQYQTERKHEPIILVGHSLGANEQIKVARNLERAHIPVEFLLTVDAVSPITVPVNVKYAYNLYKPGIVPMLSGLKLRADDPEFTHIENVNVSEKFKTSYMNHFTIDKHSNTQELMVQKIMDVINHDSKTA